MRCPDASTKGYARTNVIGSGTSFIIVSVHSRIYQDINI